MDTPWDPPTHYMHHGIRQSDYMEDLITQTWENLGKPYHFSEDQLFRMLNVAVADGNTREVHDLHHSRHPSMQLQSIDDLLQPFAQHQSSGTTVYDIHGNMPAIQHYQLHPELQPKIWDIIINLVMTLHDICATEIIQMLTFLQNWMNFLLNWEVQEIQEEEVGGRETFD